jgi:hypothetical protein
MFCTSPVKLGLVGCLGEGEGWAIRDSAGGQRKHSCSQRHFSYVFSQLCPVSCLKPHSPTFLSSALETSVKAGKKQPDRGAILSAVGLNTQLTCAETRFSFPRWQKWQHMPDLHCEQDHFPSQKHGRKDRWEFRGSVPGKTDWCFLRWGTASRQLLASFQLIMPP